MQWSLDASQPVDQRLSRAASERRVPGSDQDNGRVTFAGRPDDQHLKRLIRIAKIGPDVAAIE
jgi:hypothetical protein